MNTILKMEGIYKSFGGVHALVDVKLDVAARRIDIWLEYSQGSAICPVCGRLMPALRR